MLNISCKKNKNGDKMVKFKVGDTVKVINHKCKIGTNSCQYERCEFLGKIGTIVEIRVAYEGKREIHIKNFSGTSKWCSGFTANMLEHINKEIKQYGIVNFCKKYYAK